jgi:t-SNARE complex subunit (syntaxin)
MNQMKTMTQKIDKMEKDIQNLHSDVRDLNTHAEYTKEAVDDIKKTLYNIQNNFTKQSDKCNAKFVVRSEFEHIKLISYGLVVGIVTIAGFLIKEIFFKGG